MKRASLLIFALAVLCTAQSFYRPFEKKLGTLGFGTEYGVGEDGHIDLKLSGRFNLPMAQNLILGFEFGGGKVFRDFDNFYYYDPFEYPYIYEDIDIMYNYNCDFYIGAEFLPKAKVNPFVMIGFGAWGVGLHAEDATGEYEIDATSEETGAKIPIVLGCDFALAKHAALTAYVKATPYSTDLEMQFEDSYGIETYESVGDMRGNVHFGVQFSIPMSYASGGTYYGSMEKDKDSDGDGVWDSFDECPNTPKGTKVDERGCPVLKADKLKHDVEKELTEKAKYVTNEVHFEFNSDEITEESYPVLDEIGKVLSKHSEWKLEIAGHTDSIGTEEYNQDLSQRRARSVKNYLTSNFDIEKSKLIPVGYGELKPIADNGTKDGRALNRRVEFSILK